MFCLSVKTLLWQHVQIIYWIFQRGVLLLILPELMIACGRLSYKESMWFARVTHDSVNKDRQRGSASSLCATGLAASVSSYSIRLHRNTHRSQSRKFASLFPSWSINYVSGKICGHVKTKPQFTRKREKKKSGFHPLSGSAPKLFELFLGPCPILPLDLVLISSVDSVWSCWQTTNRPRWKLTTVSMSRPHTGPANRKSVSTLDHEDSPCSHSIE